MNLICGKLKTRDCMLPSQIVGKEPVKPISGNAGSPEPNEIDGMNASLLCDSREAAFCTSACARCTVALFFCASSTTVVSETCACKRTDAKPSASAASTGAVSLHEFCRNFT